MTCMRKLLWPGSLATALALFASVASAQMELEIMAPAAAGGGWDAAARSLQETMMASGAAESVQVVNVPGAGGTIGLAQFVTNAQADPSKLMVGGITMVGAILTNNSPVNLEQVTPIARLTADPLVIVVPADSEIQTVQDLAEAAKTDPANTIWAGGSAGGADHILAAQFTEAAGGDPSKLNYVAFSGGGEALAAMLGGRVTAGVSGYNEFQSQIETGELRALAVSSPERLEGIDVPTLTEQGYDVVVVNWRGIFAGPGISEEERMALSDVVQKTLTSPQWAETLQARGWSDAYLPSDEFAAFLTEENARVEDILRSVGLVKS